MSRKNSENFKKGQKLKQIRKMAKLSQRRVGELIGYSHGAISDAERGKSITARLLAGYCRAFNLNPEWLDRDDVEIYKAEGTPAMWKAIADAPGLSREEPDESLTEKKIRLVRELKELMQIAEEGVVDALLKNVEQFSEFSKIKKEKG